MEPTELPTLDPSVIEDDQALGAMVDTIVRLDPVAQRRAADIHEHRVWLRCAVDADVWKLVLEIDARTNERWADLAVVIARWGFEQGRRCPAPTEVSS